MQKIPKRRLNGVLLLDKASGVSSNTALQQVRRLYRAEKAGHTGVLDPLAGGLLPICFGEATKFAQYLLDADKAYCATLKLGEQTATGDAEGEIIAHTDHMPSLDTFQAACNAFLGEIEQIPPMYSALKHQGRALYDYARQGITIERQPRRVSIHALHLRAYAPPVARLDVTCSKGTYIRTLAEDIARHAGTLAHLSALRRTATAGFRLEAAHEFAYLQGLDETERDALLLPCDSMLPHIPAITLPESDIVRLQCGQTVHWTENNAIISVFRVYNAQKTFIGLAQTGTGCLKALRLMSTEAKTSA
ncbi:MAG: tRNA pseudouridine(55) synthase TruB [Neisseria sp.]|nr:tRNA pseudouridine(55) synthase TruB [Neisseria sp.]